MSTSEERNQLWSDICETFTCQPPITAEEEAFEAQAPKPRHPTDHREVPAPCYYPRIRHYESSTQSVQSSGHDLFQEWLLSGKIMTQRRGEDANYIGDEHKVLVEAYRRAWETAKHSTDVRAKDFCDALVDSMAEFLDDWGLDYFPWEELYEGTDARAGDYAPMFALVAFYSILTPEARDSGYTTRNDPERYFHAVCEDQRKFVIAGIDTKDVWSKFLKIGRCRFHLHASGKCWRHRES